MEANPMDLFGHLSALAQTLDLPYDTLADLACKAPGILTAPADRLVRAWADVAAAVDSGSGGEDGGAGRSGPGPSSRGQQPSLRDVDAAVEQQEVGGKADAVLAVLRARPELLLLRCGPRAWVLRGLLEGAAACKGSGACMHAARTRGCPPRSHPPAASLRAGPVRARVWVCAPLPDAWRRA
jgi:hypothetical protein